MVRQVPVYLNHRTWFVSHTSSVLLNPVILFSLGLFLWDHLDQD